MIHRSPATKPYQFAIQRLKQGKRWKVALSCALLAALVLLTMGLHDVNLKPAQAVNVVQQGADSTLQKTTFDAMQAIFLITILLFGFTLLYFIPRDLRKWAMTILLILSTLIFLAYLLSNDSAPSGSFVKQKIAMPSPSMPIEDNLTPQAPSSLTTEFHPPRIPIISIYLISFALTLPLLFVFWMIYRSRQSQSLEIILPPLEEIGEVARLALDDIAAGLDEKDAVINCYARMSGIVMQKRNIERDFSRTATEFASRLESAGLPGASVRRLTRLFESARYGGRASQPIEVEEAKACLTDIARHCGETI